MVAAQSLDQAEDAPGRRRGDGQVNDLPLRHGALGRQHLLSSGQTPLRIR
jgi:hypothetical protein